MQEMWVPFLGWEDPLGKKTAMHSSILAWKIPWTTSLGVAKSRTGLSDFHFHFVKANNSANLHSNYSTNLDEYIQLFYKRQCISNKRKV